jgi:hypothetical protein
MNLSEAIDHAREEAKTQRNNAKSWDSANEEEKKQNCLECAKEHEQLAEWLTELKKFRNHYNQARRKRGFDVLIRQEDAVAAINNLINHDNITEDTKAYLYQVVRKKMWELPPADLVSKNHGHWKKIKSGRSDLYECSFCHKRFYMGGNFLRKQLWLCCPECMTLMDEKVEGANA